MVFLCSFLVFHTRRCSLFCSPMRILEKRIQEDFSKPLFTSQYIAAEMPQKNRGKMHGILSIVSAFITLFLFPPLFGAIGILFGVSAVHHRTKVLGILGIVLSIFFMILSMTLGVFLDLSRDGTDPLGAVILFVP